MHQIEIVVAAGTPNLAAATWHPVVSRIFVSVAAGVIPAMAGGVSHVSVSHEARWTSSASNPISCSISCGSRAIR